MLSLSIRGPVLSSALKCQLSNCKIWIHIWGSYWGLSWVVCEFFVHYCEIIENPAQQYSPQTKARWLFAIGIKQIWTCMMVSHSRYVTLMTTMIQMAWLIFVCLLSFFVQSADSQLLCVTTDQPIFTKSIGLRIFREVYIYTKTLTQSGQFFTSQ